MVNYIIIVSAVQQEISSQEVHWKYICFECLTFHTGYLPGAEEGGYDPLRVILSQVLQHILLHLDEEHQFRRIAALQYLDLSLVHCCGSEKWGINEQWDIRAYPGCQGLYTRCSRLRLWSLRLIFSKFSALFSNGHVGRLGFKKTIIQRSLFQSSPGLRNSSLSIKKDLQSFSLLSMLQTIKQEELTFHFTIHGC